MEERREKTSLKFAGSDQPPKLVCTDGIFICNYNTAKQLCDLLQVCYPLWASVSPSIK